jgi:hypothetical protein
MHPEVYHMHLHRQNRILAQIRRRMDQEISDYCFWIEIQINRPLESALGGL